MIKGQICLPYKNILQFSLDKAVWSDNKAFPSLMATFLKTSPPSQHYNTRFSFISQPD